MAGLAATLKNPGLVDAMDLALVPRGADRAVCRLRGRRSAPIELTMRAAMPTIARVVSGPKGAANGASGDDQVVAAFAVDGIASVTALDGRYTQHGPPALFGGDEPYTVIVADVEREQLVLVRNGAGPGLYYAEHGAGWLVASEPAALHRAGLPAEPDPAVVLRFIETGACDDGAATFFAGVRRLRPDEAVTLGCHGEIRIHHADAPDHQPGITAVLPASVASGRVAVSIAPGPAGAALLGTILATDDWSDPIRVHTATFPSLGGGAALTPAVLGAVPQGSVQHSTHAFDPAEFDLAAFLRDMGEPVPDLDLYVLWEIARSLGGEVDALLDASVDGDSDGAYMARFSDRVLARYGVAVSSPLRDAKLDGRALRAELEQVVDHTLPRGAGRSVRRDNAAGPTPGELLRPIRDTVAATLASSRYASRPWADPAGTLESLRRLCDGKATDERRLLRTYLVERWLTEVVDQLAPEGELGAFPDDVVAGGSAWARVPVRTEVFTGGDRLAPKAAWYVANTVTGLLAARWSREAFRSPWFAAVAAKPVAVAQGRIRPLWEIKPGVAARAIVRLANGRLPRLADPWTTQVAIADSGFLHVAADAMAARVAGSPGRRVPPTANAASPPRSEAVEPGDGAVVRTPDDPHGFAEAFAEALRLALPTEVVDTLAGTAVVSADAQGCRVLGFASGPYADAVPGAEALIADLLADNPAGQGRECTPVVLALRARP
jgi:hypothetical protein